MLLAAVGPKLADSGLVELYPDHRHSPVERDLDCLLHWHHRLGKVNLECFLRLHRNYHLNYQMGKMMVDSPMIHLERLMADFLMNHLEILLNGTDDNHLTPQSSRFLYFLQRNCHLHICVDISFASGVLLEVG